MIYSNALKFCIDSTSAQGDIRINKMKVVYIQNEEIDFFNGKYYHSKSKHFFSRYLSGLSYDDTLTVYAGIIQSNDANVVAKYKDITNERIQYVEVPNFRKLTSIIPTYKLVIDAVKDADFCYLRLGIAAYFASRYCHKHNIPYMAIVNGDVFYTTRNHSSLKVRLAAYPTLYMAKYVINHADYALYVTKEYLQSRYPCPGKSLGCSDVEFLDMSNVYLTTRLNRIKELKQPIVLGSAGNVATVIKGQDTVIRALAELKKDGHNEYVYQLVGTGDQSILKTLAKDLGVDDMIQFMGEYSHDDVLNWFEKIDIYLHPSRSEGLPRTILEAMTKATPCICSDVGGIPELISNEFLFSYNGEEVNCLKDLILKMTTERMVEEAKKNHAHAKEYDPELLEQKRSAFLENAIKCTRESLINE